MAMPTTPPGYSTPSTSSEPAELAFVDTGPAPEAVIFDFGGVIITPITNKLARIAERHGTDTTTMLEVMMGPRYESTDHPWHRAERGEVPITDLQELVTPIAAAEGMTFQGDEYAELMDDQTYSIVPGAIELVGHVGDSPLRMGLLTNSVREFRPELEAAVDLVLFDAVVDSSIEGTRKPEPEIYCRATERVGVEPERILYLDDFDHNLGPARDLGWQVVHVTDPTVAFAQVRRLLS